MSKQYFFKNPKTGEVYGYSADEVSKNPQLMNGLSLIKQDEMKKLTGAKNASLEDAKKRKIEKITAKFDSMLDDKNTVLTVPGVGQVNGTRKDLENVKTLIMIMETEGSETGEFRLYDNSFVEVTLEQLDTISKIIAKRGIDIFKRKWELEKAIYSAETIAEVEAISW